MQITASAAFNLTGSGCSHYLQVVYFFAGDMDLTPAFLETEGVRNSYWFEWPIQDSSSSDSVFIIIAAITSRGVGGRCNPQLDEGAYNFFGSS